MEGFLTLARAASGSKQLVHIISLTLRHPSIFVFGELLSLPNIRDLESNEECRATLALLKLFAYGTYEHYKSQKASLKLADLTPAELTKLRQLTIVSRAAKEKELSYASLLSSLDLTNIRELEDLIIDTIYAGLISGTLDQKSGSLLVASAIGRDIGPTDVDHMIDTLDHWLASSAEVVASLEAGVAYARTESEKAKREKEQTDQQKKSALEAIRLTEVDKRKPKQGAVAVGGGRR